MRDFSRYNLPKRERSKSFSAYDIGGDQSIGHNRRINVSNEKAEALERAKRLHEEERRKKKEELQQAAASQKMTSIEELKRKADEVKTMQASRTPEIREPESPIESIEQDEKVGQSENKIASDEELKIQLDKAKKANESVAAKKLDTEASTEDILNAALNDIFYKTI